MMVDEDSPEWCPHFSDGTPKSQCSKCNGLEARRAEAAAEIVGWFSARYDSRIACGCYVRQGDIIGRRADDTYVCSTHGGHRNGR